MMMFMEHIKQYYYLLMLYNFTSAFSDSLSIIFPPDSEVKPLQWTRLRNTYKQSIKGPIPTFIPNTKKRKRRLWWPCVKAENPLESTPQKYHTLYSNCSARDFFQGLFWEFSKNKIKALCVNCITYSLLLFWLLTLPPTPNAAFLYWLLCAVIMKNRSCESRQKRACCYKKWTEITFFLERLLSLKEFQVYIKRRK